MRARAKYWVFVLVASLSLLVGGASLAYRHGIILLPYHPEWVLRIAMALHIVSPDDRLHGLSLIQLFFDSGDEAPSPEAQADVALAYGADINVRDADGWSALMKSAHYGGSAGVHYLTAHGANLELEDHEGNTALMLADDRAGGWAFSISGLLLAAGADACHKNHKGETPAMHFGLNTPLGRMLNELCVQKAK